MGKQATVFDHLQKIRLELTSLLDCCVRDQQLNEAAKLLTLLINLKDIDIQCSEIAKWPPHLTINELGDTVWDVVEHESMGVDTLIPTEILFVPHVSDAR